MASGDCRRLYYFSFVSQHWKSIFALSHNSSSHCWWNCWILICYSVVCVGAQSFHTSFSSVSVNEIIWNADDKGHYFDSERVMVRVHDIATRSTCTRPQAGSAEADAMTLRLTRVGFTAGARLTSAGRRRTGAGACRRRAACRLGARALLAPLLTPCSIRNVSDYLFLNRILVIWGVFCLKYIFIELLGIIVYLIIK